MANQFKRGNTFDFSGEVNVTDDGVAVTDLTGWTGECQIRTVRDTLVAELDFSWLSAANRLCRVRSTGSTAAWTLGRAIIDIKLTSPAGDVISTDTDVITIVDGATHA